MSTGIRIASLRGRSPSNLVPFGNRVDSAMDDCLDVPLRDRSQTLTRHSGATFVSDRVDQEFRQIAPKRVLLTAARNSREPTGMPEIRSHRDPYRYTVLQSNEGAWVRTSV